MTKKFISHLLGAQNTYLAIWGFMYANSNKRGYFIGFMQEIANEFKVSKSYIERVLSFGANFKEENFEVEVILAGNDTIKVFFRQSKSNKKVKEKPAPEFVSDYKAFLETYNKFCHKEISAPARMDSLQGKSLKSIIMYLESTVKKKLGENTDLVASESLRAWEYILTHWGSVGKFYSQQIKLNQINSNLPNILSQLRNGQSRTAKYRDNSSALDAISFE